MMQNAFLPHTDLFAKETFDTIPQLLMMVSANLTSTLNGHRLFFGLQSFPEELIDNICKHVPDHRDLKSLRQVAKCFSHAPIRYLFRSVNLNGQGNPWCQYLSIMTTPPILQAVRTLKLGPMACTERLIPWTRDPRYKNHAWLKATGIEVLKVCDFPFLTETETLFLPRFPCLKALDLEITQSWETVRSGKSPLLREMVDLPCLTTFRAYQHHAVTASGATVTDTFQWLSQVKWPSFRTLRLENVFMDVENLRAFIHKCWDTLRILRIIRPVVSAEAWSEFWNELLAEEEHFEILQLTMSFAESNDLINSMFTASDWF